MINHHYRPHKQLHDVNLARGDVTLAIAGDFHWRDWKLFKIIFLLIKNIKEIKQDTFIDGTENCLKLNLFLRYLIFSEEINLIQYFSGLDPLKSAEWTIQTMSNIPIS